MQTINLEKFNHTKKIFQIIYLFITFVVQLTIRILFKFEICY
jgi:hypothetical protein